MGTRWMSTYILMRILESAPSRYDVGIRMLTFGCLDNGYDRLTSYIFDGHQVLDIGCGTGALSIKAAQKGAKVKGIDVNSQMLEVAWQRINKSKFAENVELLEMGVAELGKEETENYDAVMSGLCFSELSDNESRFTLKEVKRILKPGGFLLIADETKPENIGKRVFNWIIRFPLVIITYLLTQTITHPVKDLQVNVTKAGFLVKHVRFTKMGNFFELVGQKSENE